MQATTTSNNGDKYPQLISQSLHSHKIVPQNYITIVHVQTVSWKFLSYQLQVISNYLWESKQTDTQISWLQYNHHPYNFDGVYKNVLAIYSYNGVCQFKYG